MPRGDGGAECFVTAVGKVTKSDFLSDRLADARGDKTDRSDRKLSSFAALSLIISIRPVLSPLRRQPASEVTAAWCDHVVHLPKCAEFCLCCLYKQLRQDSGSLGKWMWFSLWHPAAANPVAPPSRLRTAAVAVTPTLKWVPTPDTCTLFRRNRMCPIFSNTRARLCRFMLHRLHAIKRLRA